VFVEQGRIKMLQSLYYFLKDDCSDNKTKYSLWISLQEDLLWFRPVRYFASAVTFQKIYDLLHEMYTVMLNC
jgi:hypothetical protein